MKNKLFFLLLFFLLVSCNKDKSSGNNHKNESASISAADILKPEDIKVQKTEEIKKGNKDTVESVSTEKVKPTKETTKEKEEIKVTFVELGSVKCIPCKMMQPIMEEIEQEYGNQVKVVFYDVWTPEGKPYAERYSIRAIPTQVFLDKEGDEYFRHEGFFPKEELIKVLKSQGVK